MTNQLLAKTGSAASSMMGVSVDLLVTWGARSGGIAATMTNEYLHPGNLNRV